MTDTVGLIRKIFFEFQDDISGLTYLAERIKKCHFGNEELSKNYIVLVRRG